MQISPTKCIALENAIQIYQPVSLRKELEAFKTVLSQIGQVDLGIVIAFGQIIPQAVLDLPRLGCINVHASLLPRWRGAAPIQRCLLAGDTETGITLMQMDAGLDTGPSLAQSKVGIDPGETGGSLHEKLAELGARCLEQHLTEIFDKKLGAQPQPDVGVTYAHKITAQEGLIDWSENAEAIARKIRAFCPFPAAYSFMHGKRIKVFAANVCSARSARPGEVVSASKEALVVACGAGALAVSEVQLEGRKRMSIAEFLRGMQVPAGMKLGT